MKDFRMFLICLLALSQISEVAAKSIKEKTIFELTDPKGRKVDASELRSGSLCNGNPSDTLVELNFTDNGVRVQWKTATHLRENLKCRLSISTEGIENEKQFKTLVLLGDSAENELFTCADMPVMTKYVSIPTEYKCEKCVLRLTLLDGEDTYSFCADINSPKKKAEECKGNTTPKCVNSFGVVSKAEEKTMPWYKIFTAVAIVIIAVIVYMLPKNKKEEEVVTEKATRVKKPEPKEEPQEPIKASKHSKKMKAKKAKEAEKNKEGKEEEEDEEKKVTMIEEPRPKEPEEYIDLTKKKPKKARKSKTSKEKESPRVAETEETPVVEEASKKAERATTQVTKKKEETPAQERPVEERAVREKKGKRQPKETKQEEVRQEPKIEQKTEVKPEPAPTPMPVPVPEAKPVVEPKPEVKEEAKSTRKGKRDKKKEEKSHEEEKASKPSKEEPLNEFRLPSKRPEQAKAQPKPEDDTLIVESASTELKHHEDTLVMTGLKHEHKQGPLHETVVQVEENPMEAPPIVQDQKPKAKSPIVPEKKPEQKANPVPEEKPQKAAEIQVGDKVKPLASIQPDKKPEIKLENIAAVPEAKPMKEPEIATDSKIQARAAISSEDKPKVTKPVVEAKPKEEPKAKEDTKAKQSESNIPLMESGSLEGSRKTEEEKDSIGSPTGDIRSPTGDLALSPVQSPENSMILTDSFTSTSATTDIFTSALETALMGSIKKVFTSNQAEIEKEFKTVNTDGKATWTKTHFIFVIDCSSTMSGARWDSVTLGYDACIQKMKAAKNVYVSAFTFDTKVNPFCREKAPAKAAVNTKDIPFTGKGRNFKRSLDYAIRLIERSLHKDYLTCILFLSDGPGGDIKEQIDKMLSMRKAGSKFVVYTIGCEPSNDEELVDMAKTLQGDYYKLEKAEAARIIFYNILGI